MGTIKEEKLKEPESDPSPICKRKKMSLSLNNEIIMFFDNVMWMFFDVFLYNECVMISNLQTFFFNIKFTLNTKSVI